MNQWSMSRNGVEEGVFPESDLVAWANAGQIDPNATYLWREGLADWVLLADAGLPGYVPQAAPKAEVPTAGGGRLVMGAGAGGGPALQASRSPLATTGSPLATGAQSAALGANPYAAPATVAGGGLAVQNYGGIGRLAYFGYSFLNSLVFNGLATFLNDSAALLVIALSVIVALGIGLMRLKNTGYSMALFLLIIVPFANIWLGLMLLCAPAGYADHKTMDSSGKIVMWVIFLPIILLIALGVLGFFLA